MQYTIGIMSGTSMDALDVVLADFSAETPVCVNQLSYPIPKSMKVQIQRLIQEPHCSLQSLGELNVNMGHFIADAVLAILNQSQVTPNQVKAIGSHGQTVFHHPAGNAPFSLQLGEPNVIAAKTGITTIADFRNKDIALGGQGAPLAPLYHDALFRSTAQNRAVVNIGGIANITHLPSDPSKLIFGFDTGPGNTLLDAWMQRHQGRAYDASGQWAKGGKRLLTLLERLLEEPYFQQTPPKSTGREHFHLPWLDARLQGSEAAQDVQRTLVELTAISIARAVVGCEVNDMEVIICGGGVHNDFLMTQLQQHCQPYSVVSSEYHGQNPDWVEAMAFAWLAEQTLARQQLDYRSITGAKKPAILGGIYTA